MVRFIMVGDTGSGTEDQHRVAKAMLATIQTHKDTKAVCIVGDNIYDEGVTSVTDPQFQSKFEEPYADIDLPFYLCLGNHDYGNAHFSDGRYKHQIAYSKVSPKWNMPSRYYKQSLGPCDLFFLDTNLEYMDPSEISHQMKTIKHLYHNSKNPWKILCGHHTWRSTGGHGNAEDAFETFLQELCQACRFDMYVCGHDHCQNHSVVTLPNGHQIHNVVIGTGGKRYDDGPVFKENIHKAGDTKLHHASTRLGYTVVNANPQKLTISFHDENAKGTHTETLTKNLRKSKMKEKGKTQRKRKSKRPITRKHLRSPKRKRFKTRVRSIPKKKPYMRTRRVRRRGMKGGMHSRPGAHDDGGYDVEAPPLPPTPPDSVEDAAKISIGMHSRPGAHDDGGYDVEAPPLPPTPPDSVEDAAKISIGILTCMKSEIPAVQTHIDELKIKLTQLTQEESGVATEVFQSFIRYLPSLILGFGGHLAAAHFAQFAGAGLGPDDVSFVDTFKRGGGYIGEVHRFCAGLGESLGELVTQIPTSDAPPSAEIKTSVEKSVDIKTIAGVHSILVGILVKIGVPYQTYRDLMDRLSIEHGWRITQLEDRFAQSLADCVPNDRFMELAAKVDALEEMIQPSR